MSALDIAIIQRLCQASPSRRLLTLLPRPLAQRGDGGQFKRTYHGAIFATSMIASAVGLFFLVRVAELWAVTLHGHGTPAQRIWSSAAFAAHPASALGFKVALFQRALGLQLAHIAKLVVVAVLRCPGRGVKCRLAAVTPLHRSVPARVLSRMPFAHCGGVLTGTN